jgi:hypothetical protein
MQAEFPKQACITVTFLCLQPYRKRLKPMITGLMYFSVTSAAPLVRTTDNHEFVLLYLLGMWHGQY